MAAGVRQNDHIVELQFCRYNVYTRVHKEVVMETKVGVKEFRAHLPAYLDSVSPIAITRHGETIGYYIPAHQGRNQAELEALKQAAAKLETMMLNLRVAEDDIVADFKTRRATDKK
jgi:antitoxin (DNA-binding transcriptional repressor) of toxin-antitoxin stability system